MIRYYAIAVVLVMSAAVLATAWVNRDLIRIKIASVYAPAPPKPLDSTGGPRTAVPFRGDAPWALSALPGCVTQVLARTGPRAYVLEGLPSGATPVVGRATLSYGDCTISVGGDEAYVTRGPDRFHIPPHVQFYTAPGALAVLRADAKGNELRVYAPSDL